jgi:hypothetical protein
MVAESTGFEHPASNPSDDDNVGFDATALLGISASTRGDTSPPPRPRRGVVATHIPTSVKIAAAAGLILIVAIAIVLPLLHSHPPLVTSTAVSAPASTQPSSTGSGDWIQSHRAELQAKKSSADSLALLGNLQAAYDAYKEILVEIAAHNAQHDPAIAELARSVRATQDRVFNALLERRQLAERHRAAAAIAATQRAPAATLAAVPTSQPSPSVASVIEPENPATPSTAPTTAVAANDQSEPPADTTLPTTLPARPPPKLHTYSLPDAVTDKAIGESIGAGVKYLMSQFYRGQVGLEPMEPNPRFGGAFRGEGVDALCVYALLHAGQAMDEKFIKIDDPFTRAMLSRLKSFDLEFTYHRSLRAAALAVYDRPEDHAQLEDDVRWLIEASRYGAYTYQMPPPMQPLQRWDNSNSQYGQLGVWAGAQAGIAVPDNYWRDILQHWTECQCANGQWAYTNGNASGTLTMTCAGVASLLVASDYLDIQSSSNKIFTGPPIGGGGVSSLDGGNGNGGEGGANEGDGQGGGQRGGGQAGAGVGGPNDPAGRGLAWLDTGDNCVSNVAGGSINTGYALYGLERVGLASGYKYFGKHDWYAEFARSIIASQHFDGSWGPGHAGTDTLIDTSYALLFLSRGRHPILYNKLRFNGRWNNRPHDVENLAKFGTHELERPLNWQVINLAREWFDWMDSPVLYIASDQPLKLTDRDARNLRDFAYGGGLIFTQADHDSVEFTHSVEALCRKIFPDYELTKLPKEHDIYNVDYILKPPVPPLRAINNGSRILLLHSEHDLSGVWQSKASEDQKTAFELGINVFVYASGKNNLLNRLVSPYIPPPPKVHPGTIHVDRLRYPGQWEPEPYAWTRFPRYFAWETDKNLDVATVDLKGLELNNTVRTAFLTGTVRYDFTEAEVAATRAFVEGGGVLVIDACGGQNDFVRSVDDSLLAKAFPEARATPIPPTHPILLPLSDAADDLRTPELRLYTLEKLGRGVGAKVLTFGKGTVIFSPIDLTTGLLGTSSWGILGYEPAYAQATMKNIILWANRRTATTQATTAPATEP